MAAASEQLAVAERESASATTRDNMDPTPLPRPSADEEDGEDDRESVDGCAEHEAEQARPDNFCAESAKAGERDGRVNGPGARLARRRALFR